MKIDAKFEPVSKYDPKDLIWPARKTLCSAGYDLCCAEDTLLPSYSSAITADFANDLAKDLSAYYGSFEEFIKSLPYDLNTAATLVKKYNHKMTLVPTGFKCRMPDDYYLQLSVRSSLPLKHWIIMGNGVGIVDSDYYNNPDNEGHMFIALKNEGDKVFTVNKGDKYAQGIFQKYLTTDDDMAEGERTGGFGSTNK